jgi:hypothetical protein
MAEANLYYRNNYVSGGAARRRPEGKLLAGQKKLIGRGLFGKNKAFGSSSFFSKRKSFSSRNTFTAASTGLASSGFARSRRRTGLFSAGKMIAGGAAISAVAGAKGVSSTLKGSTLLFSSAYKAAANMKSGKIKFIIKPSFIIIGLILVAGSLSLMQLTHYNVVSTKGYELRRLEADRQQLMGQYEVKNLKLAEVKSLSAIASSDRVSVMRRPNAVHYVRGNTALAQVP